MPGVQAWQRIIKRLFLTRQRIEKLDASGVHQITP